MEKPTPPDISALLEATWEKDTPSARLEDIASSPEFHDTVLFSAAHALRESLQTCMATPGEQADGLTKGVYPLLWEDFSHVYDPECPTFVIDDGSFPGAELLGLAARERAFTGRPTANIIYTSLTTSAARLVRLDDASPQLEVTHGIIISGQQEIFVGELPEPLMADCVITAEEPLLAQLSAQGVATLNHNDLVQICADKSRLDELTEGLGAKIPPRLDVAQLWQDDPAAEYVIKPSRGSRGSGVRMFKGVQQRKAALAYATFLERNGYEPLVEQRIRCWPLLDKREGHEGELLDWSARAVMANGKMLGWYIRLDTEGKIVNLSSGAQAILPEQILEYAASPQQAQHILHILEQSARQLAERAPDCLTGADLVVDEAGQPYLFELNAGRTGGLQTMAALHSEQNSKLAPAHRLLEGMLGQPYSQGHQQVVYTVSGSERLQFSLADLYSCLRATNTTHYLAALSEAEVKQLSTSRQHLVYWLFARQQHATEESDRIAIWDDFMRLAPVEFAAYSGMIAHSHHEGGLLPYIKQLQAFLPNETGLHVAETAIHAGSLDYRAIRAKLDSIGWEPYSLAYELAVMGAAVLALREYRAASMDISGDDDPCGLVPILNLYLIGLYGDAKKRWQAEYSKAGKAAMELLATLGQKLDLGTPL